MSTANDPKALVVLRNVERRYRKTFKALGCPWPWPLEVFSLVPIPSEPGTGARAIKVNRDPTPEFLEWGGRDERRQSEAVTLARRLELLEGAIEEAKAGDWESVALRLCGAILHPDDVETIFREAKAASDRKVGSGLGPFHTRAVAMIRKVLEVAPPPAVPLQRCPSSGATRLSQDLAAAVRLVIHGSRPSVHPTELPR